MNTTTLFVMDPLESVDPEHDTTYLIMRELERRGAQVWECQSPNFVFDDSGYSVSARRVSVLEENNVFTELDRERVPVSSFDMVWMREDPPFNQKYLYATYILDKVPAPVINNPRGIRDTNEKLFILEFEDLIPSTWVGASVESAITFLKSMGSRGGVAKSLSGYGGEEIIRVRPDDSNLESILADFTHNETEMIMIQKYLPSVKETGDRRVIVLDGEPIGALTRKPSDGDFRANLHMGGEATDASGVTDRERKICQTIKPELRRRGLYFVGLDHIDGLVTEINVTSPTCVQEINRLGNVRLDQRIVDFSERLLEKYGGS